MTVTPLGDSAVSLVVGDTLDDALLARVRVLAEAVRHAALRGVVDVVPAFGRVTVFFDLPGVGDFAEFCTRLRTIGERAEHAMEREPARLVEIPVCYGGEYGPDLDFVAERAGVAPSSLGALHAGAEYLVHAIGFAPGFSYLGGLPPKLQIPRRPTPRPQVVPGSVGIGGSHTGIYPLATPGGWHLIGRTPLTMFDPHRAAPALVQAGDRVRFRPITEAAFREIEAQERTASGESERENARRVADGSARSAVKVVRAGMHTTLQDLGRRGHRAAGVPLSGAADPFAARLTNALVGNADQAAVLEFTLTGPELFFAEDTLIALGGAKFGKLPLWQPMKAPAGATLKLGPARRGCRGYLAIAGGFEVPLVLGSRSTYVRAALGGMEGRALRDGDELGVAGAPRAASGHWHIDERVLPAYSPNPVLRVVRGAQGGEFGRELFERTFKVTPQSDRMGVRLHGNALVRTSDQELVSTAVVPGTIQVPPDGQPIVLMADAQTIGGYPQVAHVITVDLPLVAQLRPGDAVTFKEITLCEAHRLWLARERTLAILREGLAQKVH